MNRLILRTLAAWRAWQADRQVARKRKQFARSNPHIVALARQIEQKRKRHQPTRADLMLLRRMNRKALGGDI
ncbi:MAG: hypothetical protein LCH86_09900 [Proteobacteria bacterium]|nr:hypothetical protein [Pseudomonadota bacterium]